MIKKTKNDFLNKNILKKRHQNNTKMSFNLNIGLIAAKSKQRFLPKCDLVEYTKKDIPMEKKRPDVDERIAKKVNQGFNSNFAVWKAQNFEELSEAYESSFRQFADDDEKFSFQNFAKFAWENTRKSVSNGKMRASME